MSVLVPYLVYNPDTGYFQNGTILNFDASYSSHTIQILVPPWFCNVSFCYHIMRSHRMASKKTNELERVG